MNFTFGIITDGNGDRNINLMIDSIEKQEMSKDIYEILIVGNSKINRKNTKIIQFNENIKRAWITKKKNIITENARHENVVYMHDYITLCDGWYNGFLKFGNDFLACMNKIISPDGSRFRDWTLFPFPHYGYVQNRILECGVRCLIPYHMNLSRYQYFSGSYFVCKKYIMEKIKLNEELCWGEGEDVEWSSRFVHENNYTFSMNQNSSVKLLKNKDRSFNEINEEEITNILKNGKYIC